MHIRFNDEYEQRLRIAVIGCGGHALRNVFPTFQYAPVDLAAVCDLDTDRATSAAKSFGAHAAYTDHVRMLDEVRPDAVFIIAGYGETERPLYPTLAVQALEAGAHAWIEKPPASSTAEIRTMMSAEKRTGRHIAVGMKKMFFPANVKARELTRRDDFGPVTSVTCRYPQHLPPLEERHRPGAVKGFLDHLVHPVSLLVYLCGPIQSIYCERGESGASVTSLRFRNGVIGALHLSHGQSPMSPLERTEIVGFGGNVTVENNIRVTYHRPGAPVAGYGRESNWFGPDEMSALHWEPEFSLGNLHNKSLFLLGYAPEILYFCECILSGTAPTVAGLDDALEVLKVYEAYLQPSGTVVRIPER